MKARFTALAAAFVLFIAAAAFAAPVRLAVLPGDGDRAPAEEVIAQLEVALTQEKDITLLERAQVRKILAEQKLSASGLTDPATAVKLGKLLAVEMFLFIERVPKASPIICQLQLIEATTGIALASETAMESVLTGRDSPLQSLLPAALSKQRVPLSERRYITVTDFRNEEPGRFLDGVAEALAMLLSTDLCSLPSVVPLDRDHALRLTQEKTLTDLEQALRTASMFITGTVRRSADQHELHVSVEICPLSGGGGSRLERTLPLDLVATRRALAEAVAHELNTSPKFPCVDPRAEAKSLATLSNTLRMRGDVEAAIRAGEAAYALNHAENECGAVREAWLAKRLLLGDFALLTEEGKRQTLKASLRATELEYDMVRLRIARSEKENRPLYLGGDPNAASFVPALALPPGELTELEDDLFALEIKSRDTQLEYYRTNYNRPNMVDLYWGVWNDESNRIRLFPNVRHDIVVRRIRDLAGGFANPPGPTPEIWMFRSLIPLGAVPQEMQSLRHGNVRVGNETVRTAYVSLWHELRRHRDPFIRMVADSALIFMDEGPAEAARQMVTVFLDELPPGHPYRTENCDYGSFAPLINQALACLKATDPATVMTCSERIIEPWLKQRNGLRIILWSSHLDRLMEAREHAGRYAEADALAAQAIEIVSVGDFRVIGRQQEAEWLLQRLRDARRRYAALMPVPNPPNDPWADYDIAEFQLPVKGEIGCSLLEGERLYCVAHRYDGKAYSYTLHTLDLYTGSVLGQPITLAAPNSTYQEYATTGMASSGKAIYVATPVGLLEYGTDAARVLSEADGLLGSDISAIAWLDGHLYMGLGTAYLDKFGIARYSPGNRHGDLIASSAANEVRSPFDGRRYKIRGIVADAERHCIWLCVSESDALRGLWQYLPDETRFIQVVEENFLPWPGLAWCDAGLLYGGPVTGVVLWDPATSRKTWVASSYDNLGSRAPAGVRGMPLVKGVTTGWWPAFFDGRRVMTPSGDGLFLRGTDLTDPALRQGIGQPRSLHPTKGGVVAVGAYGQVWVIKRK